MEIEYIDTQSVEEVATQISSLNNEYIALINKLFDRLSDVPDNTREWVGNQSENYLKLILLEKEDFFIISDDIKKYATFLKDFATDCEETINNNLTLERNI